MDTFVKEDFTFSALSGIIASVETSLIVVHRFEKIAE